MHETKEKVEKLCSMEEKLTYYVQSQIDGCGFDKLGHEELGGAIDMIKDLAEAKKDLWKACYYKTVVESMVKHEEEEKRYNDMMPSGYNHQHYANGKFAPTGKGHYVRGYMPSFIPPFMMGGYEESDEYDLMDPMGYIRPNPDLINDRIPDDPYGRPFREWEEARRHYTETKSLKDKTEMNEKALEHMETSLMSLREIWKNADPELKKQMQPGIDALTKEMKSM